MVVLTVNPTIGVPVYLDLSDSYALNSTVKKWSVKWGDGTTTEGTGKPTGASHVYTTAGLYTITLSITSASNVTSSTWVKVNVADSTPVTPPASTLVLTVPADQTATSTSGAAVAVTYPAATATGGSTPYVFTYTKPDGSLATSGSFFAVGVTTVTVRVRSSDGQEDVGTFTVTVSGAAPEPPDTTPDSFSFTSVIDATLQTAYTSNTVTISGINTDANVIISGGTYSKNGGSFTSANGTVANGDTIAVKLTSSDRFSTNATAVLTVGTVSATYSVTTTAGDTVPDQFTFVAKTGVATNTDIDSDPVTITGLTLVSSADISGGSFSVNGGAFSNATQLVNNNDSVVVRVLSSVSAGFTTSATLTIGGISAAFRVTTAAATVTIPTTPTTLTAVYNSGSVRLQWFDNANNELGYTVERRTGSGAYAQIANLGVGAASYIDGSVATNTTYTYRVRAYNSAGNSAYSNEATVTTATSSTTITVPAGGDLQAAIDAANPGDTIIVTAGATYLGNFTLPNKSGSSYITIKSSGAYPGSGIRVSPANASAMAKIQSPNYIPALQFLASSHHWRLEGLHFGPNLGIQQDCIINVGYGDGSQNTLAVVPNNIVIDRCYVHGDPTTGAKRGIGLHGATVTITNSYISDIKLVATDTQAIAGWNGPGPYTITNNYIEGAAENLLFGGARMYIPSCWPSDILIEGNTFAKPTAWRSQSWTVKNLFELKNAQRVTIRNNIFEYWWQSGQDYSIVFTPRADSGDNARVWDVVFESNTIRHVGAVFNLLTEDNIAVAPAVNGTLKNLTIKNNLIYDLSAATWGGTGRFMQIVGVTGMTGLVIDHNTVVAPDEGNAIIYVDSGTNSGTTLTNNIFPFTTYGLFSPTTTAGNGNQTIASYFPSSTVLDNMFVGMASGTNPVSNFYPATVGDVGFSNYSGGDYRLDSSSPYAAAATDGGPCGYPAIVSNASYFNQLVANPAMWKSYSLRDQTQLNTYAQAVGGVKWVNYDATMDAAKVVVPEYNPASVFTLADPIDSVATTIHLRTPSTMTQAQFDAVLAGGMTTGKSLKTQTGEVFKVLRVSGVTITGGLVPVTRGQNGTTATSHSAGETMVSSVNSLINQVQLPLGTQDGNTYLFTWDLKYTSSMISNNTGISNYKTFRFEPAWLQVDTRFDGKYGNFTLDPAFVGSTDVGVAGMRSGNNMGGVADWSLTTGYQAGPGVTTPQLAPQLTSFILKPNVWIRHWVQIQQRASDYEIMNAWIADETRDPVQLFSNVLLSLSGGGTSPNTIPKFLVEFNTSTDTIKPGRGDLVAYVRNFVALRNPSNVSSLLVKP